MADGNIKTEHDLIKDLQQKTARFGHKGIYVSGLTKRHEKCTFKCPVCKKHFLRTPQAVLSGQIFCNICSKQYEITGKIQNEECANKLERELGAIPVGKYCGATTKRKYQCPNCDSIFMRRPCNVRMGMILCKRCSYKKAAQKNSIKLSEVIKICNKKNLKIVNKNDYKNLYSKLDIKCKCGKVFKTNIASIKYQNVSTCGNCNSPKIGDRFGKLVVIDVIYKRVGCNIKCKCDCGRIVNFRQSSHIIGNKTNQGKKSCSHCNDPKIGDKFNDLTVIDIKESTSHGCKVKCKCNCGRTTRWINGQYVRSGHTKTCGNCKKRRNGKATSFKALELHDFVEKITNQKWEHNYHIQGIGNFDIVNIDNKIIIEYDGCYFHLVKNGDCTERERVKRNKVKKYGWKILIIKSSGNDYPTEYMILKTINELKNGATQRTIKMLSWDKWLKDYGKKIEKRKAGLILTNYWTPEEDKYLIENYIDTHIDDLQKNLKHRTKKAIVKRWNQIKPKNIKSKYKLKFEWTNAEKQYLLDNYLTTPTRQIAKCLNKSENTIRTMWHTIRPKNSPVKNLRGK
jgi:hypothetical protein